MFRPRFTLAYGVLLLLVGCLDPLFPAKPRAVGVTYIGNVPADQRPAVSPGAVRDAKVASKIDTPKATASGAATANNPLYALILLGVLVGGGVGVFAVIRLGKRRKASKSKPTEPTP